MATTDGADLVLTECERRIVEAVRAIEQSESGYGVVTVEVQAHRPVLLREERSARLTE